MKAVVDNGRSTRCSAGSGPAAAQQQRSVEVQAGDVKYPLGHGAVVIAAITSCTNTSNPAVMLGAGLLAKKAVGARASRRPSRG